MSWQTATALWEAFRLSQLPGGMSVCVFVEVYHLSHIRAPANSGMRGSMALDATVKVSNHIISHLHGSVASFLSYHAELLLQKSAEGT